MKTTLNANAKVRTDENATAAIVRLYDRRHAKHPVPMLAVADDLPAQGLLIYSSDPASYYFERDAHRSFFYCSAETGERIPVMLHMCSEQYNNGTAFGGVAETLVIRRLPADGDWY
jgi:hypothetical protein